MGIVATYTHGKFALGKTRLENRSAPTQIASGLNYYGYRFYDPVTGRWPSRDPIQEAGGFNLYGMLNNDSLNQLDFLGLAPDPCAALCKKVKNLTKEVAKKKAKRAICTRCVVQVAGKLALPLAAATTGAEIGSEINDAVLEQPAVPAVPEMGEDSPTWNDLLGEGLYEAYPGIFDWFSN